MSVQRLFSCADRRFIILREAGIAIKICCPKAMGRSTVQYSPFSMNASALEMGDAFRGRRIKSIVQSPFFHRGYHPGKDERAREFAGKPSYKNKRITGIEISKKSKCAEQTDISKSLKTL